MSERTDDITFLLVISLVTLLGTCVTALAG